MNRDIIDVPRLFMEGRQFNWRIDWRGQPPSEGTNGSEQVVYNRLPRFVGKPTITLPSPMIGAWRAMVVRARGRVGAYRMRMIDPVSAPETQGDWFQNWQAYQAGLYQEPRPRVACPSGAAAGATSIVVDETLAAEPIRVGAWLSYNDWPFAVVGRTGSGAETTLQVDMLRKAIPPAGMIDLFARGIFLAKSDEMGFPEYRFGEGGTATFDLVEWVNRS
ncbi:hypothetical protein [Paracoccus versutus]|uniref:Uncharacterized protein n=1 Tax=Paracoccus versutus TaxID=34007 RepID=A0A3D9XNC3_PARVE|nr:hypothetical protein [Paracoccus versutus]REF69652.1 hypothetical protein BDD41_2362 [Paracoccus versutus]WGR57976.1 hypothetical protein E3U25_18735 [Paracoccus versutus]